MEEVSVLIGRSQSGDKEAREVLIEKNLGLVHHIVKRFLGRGYDPEDLFQIGVIGLMKAIDKFDLKSFHNVMHQSQIFLDQYFSRFFISAL